MRPLRLPQALQMISRGSYAFRMRRSVQLMCISAAAEQKTGKGSFVILTHYHAHPSLKWEPSRTVVGVSRHVENAGLCILAGKLVTKTEIPAFIPRQDLMDQLIRWAMSEADAPRGLGMWGLPVKVDPYYKEEDVLWGITFTIMRDGEVATQLGVWYDDEEVMKHEWVGRGSDGFPTLEGKQREVVGKHLEIR